MDSNFLKKMQDGLAKEAQDEMDDYDEEEKDSIPDLNSHVDGVGSLKDIGTNQVGFTTNSDSQKNPPPMGKPSSGMPKAK